MAEVKISINGRGFDISCEDGQEQRVADLGQYVDARLKDIAKIGAASSEAHLLVLTNLMLADEIFDLREDISKIGAQVQKTESQQMDEMMFASTIDQLADRIDQIARRIQNA